MVGRNPGYVTTQGQIISDLLESDGHEVTSVSSRINRLLRLADVVFTLVRNFGRFDVAILATFSGPSFILADVASLVCKVIGLPLIMFLNGGNLPVFAKQHPRWVKRVMDRAGSVVAPSEFVAVHFRNLGYEVTVVPNVVVLDRYPYRERKVIRPNLLWMRSFDHVYNPQMAIRVLRTLRKSLPDATLTMAGNDKGLRKDVERMAVEMGVSDSVRFVGFLDRNGKSREFSEADIYINTNTVDNMPVSVLEARASGLPVVATEVGGIPYVIRDGVDGFMVPDNDHEAMAATIRKLCAQPDLTQQVSRNGREISERSDWQRVRRDWEMLFAELLERDKPLDIKLGGIDAR